MPRAGSPPTPRLMLDGAVHSSGGDAITFAAGLLLDGEVVAIPTDTVYGLAASLQSPEALRSIFRIKGRPQQKSLPVLLSEQAMAQSLTLPVDPGNDGQTDPLLWLAARCWPGALTVAISARNGLPSEVLAADGTVGLRVPDSRVAREVIAHAGGALAVTSANQSGRPPALDADAVCRQLGRADVPLRWVLDGGPGALGVPSTVVGRDGDRLVLLRPGAIAMETLAYIWTTIHPADATDPR